MFMARKRIRIGELELDGEFGLADADVEFDASDQLADDAWPDADAEPAMGDAALGQTTDPATVVQPEVATDQLTDPTDQSVGDAPPEVAPSDQQSEAAPSDQSEARPSSEQSEPTTQIDPVQQLLSGDDAELEARLAEAQQQVEEAATELERFNQRLRELQEAYERIGERIRELKVQRAELVPEALLRDNRRAKERLARLGADLRELEGLHSDHKLALEAGAIEGARLLATLDQHNRNRRRLQAQLASRKLIRQARAADEAAVAFLRELAAVRQCVEELVPLMPTAQQYLNQFRRGGGDLPVRLALAYHCRALGMAGILDLPPYSPQSTSPLAAQLGDLLANLLGRVGSDKEATTNAELHGAVDPGNAPAAQ
jgi:hypothetical protein